jgi:hypothetical protein
MPGNDWGTQKKAARQTKEKTRESTTGVLNERMRDRGRRCERGKWWRSLDVDGREIFEKFDPPFQKSPTFELIHRHIVGKSSGEWIEMSRCSSDSDGKASDRFLGH